VRAIHFETWDNSVAGVLDAAGIGSRRKRRKGAVNKNRARMAENRATMISGTLAWKLF